MQSRRKTFGMIAVPNFPLSVDRLSSASIHQTSREDYGLAFDILVPGVQCHGNGDHERSRHHPTWPNHPNSWTVKEDARREPRSLTNIGSITKLCLLTVKSDQRTATTKSDQREADQQRALPLDKIDESAFNFSPTISRCFPRPRKKNKIRIVGLTT
jgi:hypothetical protein